VHCRTGQPRAKPVSAIARPFGETPSGGFSWLERNFARLARTRRSIRSSRGGPGSGLHAAQSVMAAKRTKIENLGVAARHVTSPSRRAWSRQVIISKFSNSIGADRNVQNCSAATPLTPPASLTSRRSLRFPRRFNCFVSLFLKRRSRNASLRNFDTELHCPYCYRPEPYDRWESVANARTAADLHVRPGP
jgi:hypothetical protein